MPLHHPSRHCQRTTDTQSCRRCRAATQEPLPRRDHPHRDVTAGAHAAPGRACPASKAPSHPLPWRPRAQRQPPSRDHSILRGAKQAISLCLAFPARRSTHPALQRFILYLLKAGLPARPVHAEAPHPSAPARLGWARLLKRVFDIDSEQCPQCGGTLTILAAIEDPPVIAKILTHLGLSARAPPRSPARSFDRLQMA